MGVVNLRDWKLEDAWCNQEVSKELLGVTKDFVESPWCNCTG